MRKKLLPLVMLVTSLLIGCDADNVRPKELEGDWKLVSGTYSNIYLDNSAPPRKGMMRFNMKFTKTEETRYSSNANNTTVMPYTVKGKIITSKPRGGGKIVLTVKELTDHKLVWHQDYIDDGVNYTMDMEFER